MEVAGAGWWEMLGMGKRIGGETGTGYDHIMSHWGDWSGVELG
jgi:hypothetical protein